MAPLTTGDRSGLGSVTGNRVPGLWVGKDSTFMISTGLNGKSYYQTFYRYQTGKKHDLKRLIDINNGWRFV